MRRDEQAQLNIIEAIMVGVIVFTAVAFTAVFRLPTSAASFQQAELERIGSDAMIALTAKTPDDPLSPFRNELERVVSLALDFENAGTDTDPLRDFFDQALPEGSFYIFNFGNGIGTRAVYPKDRSPPAADVVVAHALMGPAWLAQDDKLGQEMFYLRPGEYSKFSTGTDPVTQVNDPLGRSQDEEATTIKDLFTTVATGDSYGRVPLHAPYGTYEVCRATCGEYFAVVPPGIAGPGSLLLESDKPRLKPIAALLGVAEFGIRIGFAGADADPAGESLYLDVDESNAVSVGDLRLTKKVDGGGAFEYASGSFVKAGDTDVTTATPLTGFASFNLYYRDDNGSLAWDPQEAIYLDYDQNGVANVGEHRLSRAGAYGLGSAILAGDADELAALRPLTVGGEKGELWCEDIDEDGCDADDPILFGFDHDPSGYDYVHLSPRGTVTQRYLYDIRLVVWFGI